MGNTNEDLLKLSCEEKLEIWRCATEGEGDVKALFKCMLMSGMMTQEEYDEFSNMPDDDNDEAFDGKGEEV